MEETTTAVPGERDRTAHDLILDLVEAEPGIGQAELVERVREAGGLSASGALAAIRSLERDGELVSRRLGRRKAYVVAASAAELSPPADPDATQPLPLTTGPTPSLGATEAAAESEVAGPGPDLRRRLLVFAAALMVGILINVLVIWILVNA